MKWPKSLAFLPTLEKQVWSSRPILRPISRWGNSMHLRNIWSFASQRSTKNSAAKHGRDTAQRLGDPANPLQLGQQLTARHAPIARVADPAKLKAAIKIAETQAQDVQLEQPAVIDTRNGVVPGHVIRIDPAVEDGTVTVDVALDAALPKGARPDLSIDGTIQLERLENVLYVGRPVQGQPDSKIGLFKLIESGKAAMRVPVSLGRSSVSTIEIVEGLQVGDQGNLIRHVAVG